MPRKFMTTRREQLGFSLVTAIFLLTVLASLAAFIVVLSGVAQQTPVLGLNGAQAYHAARSGLEWGIDRAVNGGGACNGSFSIDGYTVTVSCPPATTHDGVEIYAVGSVASTGTPGNLNYASRQLRAAVSPSAP